MKDLDNLDLASSSITARIEKTLTRLPSNVTEGERPGMVVCLYNDHGVLYHEGFGIDRNALFPIGSCTKYFTGTEIAYEVGTEGLASPWSITFSPDQFPFLQDPAFVGVTLKDVLQHRTPLDNLFPITAGPGYAVQEECFCGIRPWPSADDLRQLKPGTIMLISPDAQRLPEGGYAPNYRNSGYALVGLKCSLGWEDAIRKNQLLPNQLQEIYPSFRCVPQEQIGRIAPGFISIDKKTLSRAPLLDMEGFNPAGGIIATAENLAAHHHKLEAGNLRLGADGKHMPLEVWHQQMHFTQKKPYSLGLQLHETPAGHIISHEGGVWGYRSRAAHWTPGRVTMVVFMGYNSSDTPWTVNRLKEGKGENVTLDLCTDIAQIIANNYSIDRTISTVINQPSRAKQHPQAVVQLPSLSY